MVQFIQNFFLSPFLIFIILMAVFIVLSWWATQRRKEYVGYGLGWLIGVFGMVIYGALVGEPEPVAQSAEATPITLNILQVIFPSLIGIVMGASVMSLIRRTTGKSVQNSIVVAVLTALSLGVLFLMIVSTQYPVTQRMIGLFSLAFAIGALTMLAILRQTPTKIQSGNIQSVQPNPNNPRQNIPTIPMDADEGKNIRNRIRRR